MNVDVSSYQATSPATLTLSATPSVGDTLIIAVLFDDNYAPGSVSAITDNQTGNTYSLVKAQNDGNGGNNCRVELWRCDVAGASGTFTISAAYTGTQNVLLVSVGYPGGLGAADQTVGAGTNAATATVTEGAPNANASEFVIGAIVTGNYGAGVISAPAGYTEAANTYAGSNNYGREVAYKIVSSVETSSATWNWTTASQYAAVLATFKMAGGASGNTIAWLHA